MKTDVSAIKEVLNQYARGCSAGDFDLWMSLWADDGVQMPPDSPALVGKEDIGSAAKPEFDDLDMKLTILSIEDAEIFGSLGLTRCVYRLEVTPKAGGETIVAMPEAKALTLYQKQSDGTWKILYDCFNSSVPAE
jgi:ketosteroid isomerase-like protein